MKLYYTQKSPFLRKALVVALEAGVEDKPGLRYQCVATYAPPRRARPAPVNAPLA